MQRYKSNCGRRSPSAVLLKLARQPILQQVVFQVEKIHMYYLLYISIARVDSHATWQLSAPDNCQRNPINKEPYITLTTTDPIAIPLPSAVVFGVHARFSNAVRWLRTRRQTKRGWPDNSFISCTLSRPFGRIID